MKKNVLEICNFLMAYFKKYWLISFYIVSISFFELIYRLWTVKTLNWDISFSLLFAFPAGFLLFVTTCIFPRKAQKLVALILVSSVFYMFAIQLVYFNIFHMPLYLYSFSGATSAFGFKDIVLTGIKISWFPVIILCLPALTLMLLPKKIPYFQLHFKPMAVILGLVLISYLSALFCVNCTGNSPVSQKTQYHQMASLELSISKLGLLTSMRLDLKHLLFGTNEQDSNKRNTLTVNAFNQMDVKAVSATPINVMTDVSTSAAASLSTPEPPKGPLEIYNMMDIDFESIIAAETNEDLLEMHQYFQVVPPTERNEYTGMFEGYNLIFMTCEAFSPYAISEDLTPTLYKMVNSGFLFNQFYNPVWGVSTSDGEYVACTGLIPKSGVWSFSRSSKNYLPFVMGNQFQSLGYKTNAYHNHSYTYYDRHLSHPNMGYEYKALGHGLDVKETWPESDLEMIELTSPEYISTKPFHAYFMTVSGHMNYSFTGNFIASKNKSYVEDLPYTDTSKAYIACSLELEFALTQLIENLESAGVLDKTVIVMSPDHYPYGLPKENIDELAGQPVENNFELYKSSLIIWNSEMEKVVVDTPCESLDIIPTLSNLFGLEYDSRLLMGSDILSNSPSLVIFSNRSWITDRANYNSLTDTVTFFDGTENDLEYVASVNQIVNDKFKYSRKILELDYYSKIFVVE